MEVTCTPFRTAYSPLSVDETRELWLPPTFYRMADDPALPHDPRIPVVVVRREAPGHDGTPVYVDGGCGRTFEFDDVGPIGEENVDRCVPASRWDLNVEYDELGFEHVIERHLDVRCPYCNGIADHLSVPVEKTIRHEWWDEARDREAEEAFGQAYREASEDLRFAARMGWVHYYPEISKWLPIIQGGSQPAPGYFCGTEGAVALSAATAKTVCAVKAHANSGCNWLEMQVGFDGVSASAVSVLVEPCYITFATNGPGTNSTSTTPRQKYGRVLTVGFTSGKTWTTEPTVVTVPGGERLITPNGGTERWAEPLGQEMDTALAEGFGLRITAPATVNVRSGILATRA